VDVFDEDEGWEEARDEDGIRTMYRYEEGLPTISVRIEGAVDASVLQVSFHRTVNLFPLIFRFMEWSTIYE